MIRGRTTVVCSASVFLQLLLWQAENSSRSPSDLCNTLKPHWNLWQKLLFLLAFENHLLFLGLGHLLFRLMVKHFVWALLDAIRNTECSALARSRNIACVTGTERGGAGGGGEKWNIKRGIYIDFVLQEACKVPLSMVFERNIANSVTITKSFEKSAEHAQVLVNFLSTCS